MCSDWDEADRPATQGGPLKERRGTGSDQGPGALLRGQGEAGSFLTWAASAEAPPSLTAPRRPPSSWGRTCSRYKPGLAAGGKAGPRKLSAEDPARTPSGGAGLSHSPSCWPWGLQEEGRERWFLLWE